MYVSRICLVHVIMLQVQSEMTHDFGLSKGFEDGGNLTLLEYSEYG